MKTNWPILLAPLVGGSVSGLVSGIGKQKVPKVEGQPPDWVFGPVWTVLYLMMGYAANIVYQKTGKVPLVFWLQLALNLIWSPVYFRKNDPRLALNVIIALWVAILFTIVEFAKIDAFASRLLWPYLAWVTYATTLLLKRVRQ